MRSLSLLRCRGPFKWFSGGTARGTALQRCLYRSQRFTRDQSSLAITREEKLYKRSSGDTGSSEYITMLCIFKQIQTCLIVWWGTTKGLVHSSSVEGLQISIQTLSALSDANRTRVWDARIVQKSGASTTPVNRLRDTFKVTFNLQLKHGFRIHIFRDKKAGIPCTLTWQTASLNTMGFIYFWVNTQMFALQSTEIREVTSMLALRFLYVHLWKWATSFSHPQRGRGKATSSLEHQAAGRWKEEGCRTAVVLRVSISEVLSNPSLQTSTWHLHTNGGELRSKLRQATRLRTQHKLWSCMI